MRGALTACMGATALLCALSLAQLPRVWPLYSDPAVRRAAPNALAQLRAQGLWLVNTELQTIEREGGAICFVWEHRYHARTAVSQPKTIRTCVPPPA